jgi:glycosyltransferase involved in cell wall biosynthesis
MRVLSVLPFISARVGGPPIFAVEAAAALRRLGVEVELYATDLAHVPSAFGSRHVLPSELPDAASRLEVRLFPTRTPHRLALSPSLGTALRRNIRAFDVVHIHSLWLYPQFAAAREARRVLCPYIVSPHGALDPFLRQRGRLRKGVVNLLWQDRMLKQADLIHVTSVEEAALINDIAPRVPRRIIPAGLETAAFGSLPDGSEFRRRYLGGYEGPIVLFLGRITFKKGLDILIRALALVRDRLPATLLAIVGPDDEGLQPRLETLTRDLHLSSAVTFTGALYGEDRLAALAAADVWALSSHTENFGIAVLEALAAGVPSVISPAVNIADEVARSGAALVAALTPESFADALVRVLTDPNVRSSLQVAGPLFADQYDWSAVAPELVRMYEGLVA